MKQSTVVILPYETLKDIAKAEKKQSQLMDIYNSVKTEQHGLRHIKIVATN